MAGTAYNSHFAAAIDLGYRSLALVRRVISPKDS